MKKESETEPAYFVQKISIRPDCLFFAKEFIIHIDLSKIWFINQTIPKNIQSELRRKNEKSKTDPIGCNCIQHSHGAFDTGAGERKEYLLVNGASKPSKETGGQLRMYYQEKDSILLKGKAKKSASRNQIDAAKQKK